MARRAVVLVGVLVAALVLLTGVPAAIDLAADWYWFSALGFQSVFLTALTTKVGLGLVVGVAAGAFVYANLRFAQRGMVPDPMVVGLRSGLPQVDVTLLLRRAAVPVAVLFGLLMGAAASGAWITLLRFRHRVPFEVVDPIFLGTSATTCSRCPLCRW